MHVQRQTWRRHHAPPHLALIHQRDDEVAARQHEAPQLVKAHGASLLRDKGASVRGARQRGRHGARASIAIPSDAASRNSRSTLRPSSSMVST